MQATAEDLAGMYFGNPGNYVSSGFVSCKKKNVSFTVDGNYPTALLVCELVPGALNGEKWIGKNNRNKQMARPPFGSRAYSSEAFSCTIPK